MVKDFWPLFVKQIANSLDFGDFRQIILYFGLSTWTHIEYRIKSSTLTYSYFFSILDKQYVFIYILCEHFVPIDIRLMHKTYRPSMFSVLLQLKDLISENMKISK